MSTMPWLAVSSERKTLVTGDGNYGVIVWDVADPARPQRIARIGKDQRSFLPHSVGISPNGRTVAVRGCRLAVSFGGRVPTRFGCCAAFCQSGDWLLAFDGVDG
jgi:hypothetical protein